MDISKGMERIIVLYKPHQTKVSIMRKAFDPQVHEYIPAKTVEIVSDTVPVEVKKQFCDQCASKGGRHLKSCPTLKAND